MANWPQPLPDTRHSHDGWTWGSFGGVYAETPDRIWIAMRGELPLPAGAKPWTPYAALDPTRGNAQPNSDGLTATCEPTAKRGWERRFEHVLFVVDRNGRLVQEWPQHDKLFAQHPCGRGPHTIKMSPYDPAKHVWVIDDQNHVIYRFTYDGKLVKTFGQLGVRGRGPNTFDRPTDIAWLPDGTFFISDGYGGKRVAKFDAKDNFIMDWGQAPKDPKNPGPSEFNTPHSIAISRDRRVFVVDRGHQRMQVFDENGKFLDMWSLRSPNWPASQGTLMVNHIITTDQFIWVGDCADQPSAEVRSRRELSLQLGRTGWRGWPVELLAWYFDRPGGKSFPGRLHGRPRAEVHAGRRRRSNQARGADSAVPGEVVTMMTGV